MLVVGRLSLLFVEAPLLLRLHVVLLGPLALAIVFAAMLLLLLAPELLLLRPSPAILELLVLLGKLAILLRDPPTFRVVLGAALRLLVPALLIYDRAIWTLLDELIELYAPRVGRPASC